MKLIFEGTKKLEQIEDFKEFKTLEEYVKSIPDIQNSIYSYQSANSMVRIWELNELFRDGYSLSLKNLEVPIDIESDKEKIYDHKLVEWSSKEYPELVARGYGTVPVENGKPVFLESELELHFKNRKNKEAKIFGCRNFGRNILGHFILDSLIKDIKGTPKEKQLDSLMKEARKTGEFPYEFDIDYADVISNFLTPKRKISTFHFEIILDENKNYLLSDPGSLFGTWVDDAKIGLDSHPYLWRAVEFFNGKCRTLSIYDADERIFSKSGGRFEQNKNEISRRMNEGYVSVKDGSEIVLGKNEFGDEYKFRLEVNKNE